MAREPLPEILGIDDYETIRDEAALNIAQAWLAAFCPQRTSFKGILRNKSYMWDVMGCDLQRDEALAVYESHRAPSYILMEDCFGFDEKVVYVTPQKPDGNKRRKDFHVFPKNMAWSMAFTHEDGWIGPLFSKHKDYEALNLKNSKAMATIDRYAHLKFEDDW